MSGFNWPVLMRAGMTGLRLTPDQFWRLTPAELQLMLGQGVGTTAMNRAGLDALLAAYPDTTQGERDDGS
ncbi:rcc01693 family protein [Ruegeria arenilitoris]|uniref:rcc01693 family protein n=1 Tax=Ruegeria arenilitoris TaxID=1173585 RepID=UPI0014804226